MKNFSNSLVTIAPSPATSGTSLTVTAGQGVLFDTGNAMLWPSGNPSASTAEIVSIINISGDTLTIQRAAESSSARSIAAGWSITQGITAGEFTSQINSLTASTLRASSLIGGMAVIATDAQFGITGDGVTDDRPAIQALFNAAAAANIPEVYFPPGTYRLNSLSVSNGGYPDLVATGSLTFALTVPPTVSVRGAGSGRCKFLMTVGGNTFMVRSTLTTVATVTVDTPRDTTVFTVDSTAGFAVGDTVATHFAQNASDPQEARWTVFATVTAIGSATSMTLDTPSEWAMTTAASLAVNRRFYKVTAVAEKMKFEGFHIQGGSVLRHGIGVMWARQLMFKDLTAYDIGSGIINAQFIDNCSARDIYVYKSGAYSNTSKGRGISLSNVTNFTIENFTADYCDAAALYLESYCRGIRVNGWRINNRSTARSVAYLIFCGLGCDLYSDGLTVQGYNPSAAGADSIISYGPSDGRATFHNTTLYMMISQIRAFPMYAATGMFRCFDNSGNLITFNMNKVDKTPVSLTLTDGGTTTAWMRAGLVVAVEAEVPTGVTSSLLTTFTTARVGIGSLAIPWVANRNVNVEGWVGTLYPVWSKWDQSLRVQAIVAASAGLTGTKLNVNVWSVAPDGYQTVVDEPGSTALGVGRFGPNYAV